MKGLSMPMQLIITAIVLVIAAVTILILTTTQIIGGSGKVTKESLRRECIALKDAYCINNPDRCWYSAADLEYLKIEGKKCSEILGVEDKPYFDCGAETESEGWMTKRERDSKFKGVNCGP